MYPDENDTNKDITSSPLDRSDSTQLSASDPAVEMIRDKISNIYKSEPNAGEEIDEVKAAGSHKSKHQQFMYELINSGESLAEIQTAWHNYYVELPDSDKHQVWQEFYEANSRNSHGDATQTMASTSFDPAPQAVVSKIEESRDRRTTSEIKSHLLKQVSSNSRLKKSDHLKSLFFGLSMGGIVVIILLFSFFNERFIAPFITPSRKVSSTSIIINPGDTNIGPEPKIIIPKINVEAPVIYDEPSINDKAVQRALENGVLHYPTSPDPGELGNGAIFGHSSGNIFNVGKYKFAFILLKSLSPGDTFYIQKNGKRFVYKVFDKKIVKPSEVAVLNSIPGKPATFTLITCDPPGTSANRLIVIGEQISPDPNANVASHVNQDQAAKPATLPSNSPTLWNRLWKWLTI